MPIPNPQLFTIFRSEKNKTFFNVKITNRKKKTKIKFTFQNSGCPSALLSSWNPGRDLDLWPPGEMGRRCRAIYPMVGDCDPSLENQGVDNKVIFQQSISVVPVEAGFAEARVRRGYLTPRGSF